MNLKVNKHIQVGLMVVLALIVFIWGYNYLKGRNILQPSNDYFLKYTEISGIMESDPVLIRGLRVGQVNDIYFDPANPKFITIRIVVDKSLRIPKDSKAMLSSIDMLGSKGIVLDIGTSGSFHQPGDTLNASIKEDMLSKLTSNLGPVKDQGASIITNTDSVLMKVNNTMNQQTMENIQAVTDNLKSMTEELSKWVAMNQAAMTATVENLKLTMEAVAQERENIAATLANLKTISDQLSSADLANTMASLDSTMQNLSAITYTLSNEEGSLQKLMNDPELYMNLTEATESANLLLEDVRKYPSRYVHLSLVNKNKSTYMDEEGVVKKLADNEKVSFLIVVKKSSSPIEITSEHFKTPNAISEFEYKDEFYYHTGENALYSDALERIDKVKETYPNAFIQVLKKGKPVPLEKVLR